MNYVTRWEVTVTPLPIDPGYGWTMRCYTAERGDAFLHAQGGARGDDPETTLKLCWEGVAKAAPEIAALALESPRVEDEPELEA